jgi:TonB family protein
MRTFAALAFIFMSLSVVGQKKGKIPVNDTIYEQPEVEEGAEFPGGQDGLVDFLAKNIKYPIECSSAGIQGKVYIEFIIEKNGKVTNVKIKREIHPLLDKEATRVVTLMPKWKPARKRSQKARSKYILPINYKITQ